MGFVGRADLALAAIEKMSTELAAYEIIVYSTDIHSRRIIKRLRRTTNLNLRSFKKHSFDHSSMMDLFRQSRIHIGISESDGIPGSLREAMLSGCIPIQTNTSCADEWISNYKSGFLVSINDINQIIDAIRTALYNVDLIDSAAELNRIAAFNYLSRNSNQDLIQDLYHC
jgi:glycosyltransferase involved in cell wall biosynthesis